MRLSALSPARRQVTAEQILAAMRAVGVVFVAIGFYRMGVLIERERWRAKFRKRIAEIVEEQQREGGAL
jgi:hypothetical protein